ncbi:hypothetical protein [Synechococcus sp. LTW-G]
MTSRSPLTLLLICAAMTPVLGLLPAPAFAHGERWSRQHHHRAWRPVRRPRQETTWRERQTRALPVTQAPAVSCNTGRLLGGLTGGAAAYALSRQDGRAWAIPLGALLGSQMGCSVATGRGPVPW